MTLPTILTTRLVLRAFAADDFEPYFERILSDAAVMRWLGGTGLPLSREEELPIFKRITDPSRDERDRIWAVVERETGEFIGHAILQRLDKGPLIEVGYALGRRWWGAGLATEAARALVDYGFEDVGLDLVTGVARPDNGASRRVLEKVGLTYSGMRRYYEKDLAFYELPREVWERQ